MQLKNFLETIIVGGSILTGTSFGIYQLIFPSTNLSDNIKVTLQSQSINQPEILEDKFDSYQNLENSTHQKTPEIKTTNNKIQPLSTILSDYVNTYQPTHYNRVLEVDKSDRKLTVILNNERLKTYDIALGIYDQDSNQDGLRDYAKGDKQIRGDRKTPEGTFYVSFKHENGSFSPDGHSLVINYPNLEDAKRGLDNDLINEATYNKIKQQQSECRPTQMGTKLGDSIVIHGGGSSQDWTWGCVALNDDDIAEVYQFSTQMQSGNYDPSIQNCGTMVIIKE